MEKHLKIKRQQRIIGWNIDEDDNDSLERLRNESSHEEWKVIITIPLCWLGGRLRNERSAIL